MITWQGFTLAYPFVPESEETTEVVDTLALNRLTTYSGAQRWRFQLALETTHETDPRIGALRAHFAAYGTRDRFLAPIPQSHPPVRLGTDVVLRDADVRVVEPIEAGSRLIRVMAVNHAIQLPAGALISFLGLGTGADPQPRKLHIVDKTVGAAKGDNVVVGIFPGLPEAVRMGTVVNVTSNWWRYADIDALTVPTDEAGMCRPMVEWIEG